MNKRIRKKISKRGGYYRYKDFKQFSLDFEEARKILNEIDGILAKIKDPLEYLYNFINEVKNNKKGE